VRAGIVDRVIQFTRAGAASGSTNLVLGSDLDLEAARKVFFGQHCVKVPGFLAGDLFSEILAQMRPDDFYERAQEGLGSEACLEQDSPVLALLWLLLNDDRLFHLVEALTGCPAIGSFQGRVYRFTDSPRHHDDWHDDLGDNRLVALSVNLSSQAYDGGLLQIRGYPSGEILHEESNTGPGDALIFRIAPELQHRVARVTGNRPKTAFAGWFKSAPDFKTMVGLRQGP
jgi:2OG-Fe(II) oxygenase superfamily